MTDVPPGNDGPGNDPDPAAPSGPRRSTFTPPNDAESPAFDDDALAAALAAEVSAYTSPIAVTRPATPAPTPVQPEPADPDEPELPPAWMPAEQPAAFEPTPFTPAPEPVEPEPVEPEPAEPEPEPEPAEPEPVEHTSSATLEAIERLESELRRRAENASGPVDLPPVDLAPADAPPVEAAPAEHALPPTPAPDRPFPDSPLFPAPPTFIRSAPPVDAPVFGPPPIVEPTIEPIVEPNGEPINEPLDPPSWEPQPWEPPPSSFGPPPLVEPPTPTLPPFPTPAVPFGFGPPPVTAPIDLPPPDAVAATGTVDLTRLPPPVGITPAPIPPYDPASEVRPLAPPPADFAALLGGTPPPHPDDFDAGDFGAPAPPGPTFAPLTSDDAPREDDDDVDEVDRAFNTGAIAVDSTGSAAIIYPPSQPIPTVRLSADEAALVDEEPESHPALVVESAGTEPTALDLRAGRAARLFWLWFAANSSVVTLSLGAVLFGLGMSLRQTLIAIVIGVALSFLPLGLVTLAGKWSGQPTMVVSRATFGLAGNVLPAVLAVVSRVLWGGALLWTLATGVARVLVDSGLDAGLSEGVWTLVALAIGFALAFVVAIFGYGLVARVQLVLSILTGVLVVGVIAVTFPRLDLEAAQLSPDGSWTLVITGVVLVFSFVGLAWVHSSADLARYQRTESDGGSTMLWATFGATLPAFLLIAWGALLAASDPLIADGLATNPLHTIAAILPLWYPAPLVGALALGLLSGVVLTMYSGGFALQSLGIRTRRSVTTVIAGILVLALSVGLVFLVGDARGLIRDVATTIAVPIAAWAGIFSAEMMIRRRGFDSDALLRRGGIYPAVRWANLIGLVVITALGFGLTSAALPGLDWQGYLFPFLGLRTADPLLTSDVGVLVALVLGILLPLVSAVPAIRRQERALGDDLGAP